MAESVREKPNPTDDTPDADTPADDAGGRPPDLDELGLAAGDPVRWRRQAGARWNQGVVIRREADGSVAVRDRDTGAWRSLPIERLEAQGVTRRGTKRWESLAERAARGPGERPQMKLW